MSPYTNEELLLGKGAFEHVINAQTSIPGFRKRMSAATAIGILAAMMRSELPAAKIDALIDSGFSNDAALLKKVLTRYEGNDWSMDLWHLQPDGRYKLCTDLCSKLQPGWRYNRTSSQTDW